MKFTPAHISGSYKITLEKREDERGFFARAFDEKEFAQKGLETHFPQSNISHCVTKGTIRGLHYQRTPHGEAKFIRVLRGKIFSVAVDVRQDSSTFKKWQGIELSTDEAVYVPEGCANGYESLTDNSAIFYCASHPYTPEAERGIRWNDPTFNIQWPVKLVAISQKDASWPDFKEI